MRTTDTTLTRFLIEQHPEDLEFTMLLTQIGTAAKVIASEIRRAGLVDITGMTGDINVQGETVKKLDEFSNAVFVEGMEDSRLVCQVVSEEMEKPLKVSSSCAGRKYSVLVDPLDGSSNADINGVVGTIFSLYDRPDVTAEQTSESEVMRTGTQQVAAGYVMYGPSTILVYSSGKGVHGFTLDPGPGEFILSHEHIQMPASGKTYAVNHGNRAHWLAPTEELIEHLVEVDDSTGRPYRQRWVGSLTADFHRILLEGGLYLYPGDRRRPDGKLRLLYECMPLALLAEQAGGRASSGTERILEIEPKELHQRIPLIIGSREDVELAEKFYQDGAA